MLKIIGTNHLMKEEEIIRLIDAENPEIIGIELCKIREYIYLNKINTEVKEDNSLLGKISNAIKKKAKEQNVEYGCDMYSALTYSINNKIPYVLIDKDIQEIQQLFQKIPQNEQQGFMNEIVEFEKQTIIPTSINEDDFLSNLKKNYPISFEILINLREYHIALSILKIITNNPEKRVIIILGKGHIKGVNKLLGYEF